MKQKEKKETNPKSTFVCQRCGYCCIYSSPSLTREEYDVLKRLKITMVLGVKFVKHNFGNRVVNNIGGKNVIKEYCYFTKNGYYNFMYANNVVAHKPCEFLSKDEQGKYHCLIYSHRPQVCKDFGVVEWECPTQKKMKEEKKEEKEKKKRENFFIFFIKLIRKWWHI